MTKPILEVVEHDLKYTNEEVEQLKKQVKDLLVWKETCTKWAAWWAGVCAAVMTIAALIQTYWDKIITYIQHGAR